MAVKHNIEKEKNIEVCSKIRDDETAKPIAVIQAVRAINRLLPKENPDSIPVFDDNLKALIAIRDNGAIEDTIRIMAMNTINTMLESVGDVEEETTEEDIMRKIRGAKR